jgi:hypothetical protein
MANVLKSRPLIAVGVLILLIIVLMPHGEQRPASESAKAAQPAVPPIPYALVETWDIPCSGRDGMGRVIVVDSAYRTDSELRRLGEQLREERPQEWCSNVEVFDDSLMATLRDKGIGGDLRPKSKQARFDSHYLGLYFRNRHSRTNELTFGLQGITKDSIVSVKY